eukprot:4526672-Alexandrium_andersonii.AAC.1
MVALRCGAPARVHVPKRPPPECARQCALSGRGDATLARRAERAVRKSTWLPHPKGSRGSNALGLAQEPNNKIWPEPNACA